jgi:hypothetical protein
VRLTDCLLATGVDDGTASFTARMARVAGGPRMSMRFTLLEQFGSGGYRPLRAPGLGVWRKSRLGSVRFSYEQAVTQLRAGGAYKVAVEFRWQAEDRGLVRSARRTSPVCRQAGGPPNLRVDRMRSPLQDAAPSGQATYLVEVVNDGGTTARAAEVLLSVDGGPLTPMQATEIQPGRITELAFQGPACRTSVRAVADPRNTIRESVETDNVRVAACGALASRR